MDRRDDDTPPGARPRPGRPGSGTGGRERPAAGPVPDAARLREAALAHLARFAATEVGLRRVLERRVDRWAHRAGAEPGADPVAVAAAAAAARALAAGVAAAQVAAGVVDDGQFAAARARRLHRAGRSSRAIAAHLAGKGVAADAARAALPAAPAAETDAALAQCRRRRIGPFAPDPDPDPDTRRRWLAALARAGFPHEAARAALATEPARAEERLLALRRDG